ncbi:MAG: hypothetical protein J6N19_08495 [Clostridium sp.]|nr:hypothetical protein [Clostridium sp.]
MFLNMKSIVKKTVTAELIGSIAFTLASCGSSSGGQTTTELSVAHAYVQSGDMKILGTMTEEKGNE